SPDHLRRPKSSSSLRLQGRYRQWQTYGKRASLTGQATHIDSAAMRLYDVLHNSQSESCSGRHSCRSRPSAIKLLEDSRLFFRLNADSMIGHIDYRFLAFSFQRKLHAPRASRILHGIRKKVQNGLLYRIGVRSDETDTFIDSHFKLESLIDERILH